MNSTSFLEAAEERRGVGRGGVRWEGGSGGRSYAMLDSGPVITTSGTVLEGWSFREEELEVETEGVRFGKRDILEDVVVHGRADEAPWRVGWELASNGSDKRRGELGMLKWIRGFSKATDTIDSTVRGSEAREVRIRVRIRCNKVVIDLKNFDPMPRSTSDAANNRIRVPAPRLEIVTLMVDYREG